MSRTTIKDNTYRMLINEHQRNLLRRGLARLVPRNEADADEWADLSAIIDALPGMEEENPGSVHNAICGVPA